MKTATIKLKDIKDADGWIELAVSVGISPEEASERYFKYGEYASLEIEVDENLHIVGGRIVPRNEQ